MEIDKIEQMVHALDGIIEQYNGREMNPRTFNSFRNEIYSFYRNMLFPYCEHSMSKAIIRNELIDKLGEVQGNYAYNRLF